MPHIHIIILYERHTSLRGDRSRRIGVLEKIITRGNFHFFLVILFIIMAESSVLFLSAGKYGKCVCL